MDTRVAIIGGYGGMGRIFAGLFKDNGCDVMICGPTISKGQAQAEKMGVQYCPDNKRAAAWSDVTVITVPIGVTEKAIKEVAPHVRPGCLLMDLTSVKGWPCDMMAECAHPEAEVIGTHPVFGPRVGSVGGQVVVLTPIRGDKWIMWLKKILDDAGARTVDSDPKEHDRVMAIVQGLTHYAYISVGKTLNDLGVDIKRTRTFSSPVYDLMLDMIGRIIGQDPHLYAEIQMTNPEIMPVHEAFIKAATRISDSVRLRDEKAFVGMMGRAAKHFGHTERAMGRSDKAIASIVQEALKLKESMGKEICLEHIYSKKVHIGVVEDVMADEVVIRCGARKNRLKISNLSILDGGRKIKEKAKKYGEAARDYSIVIDEHADPTLIGSLACLHIESVLSWEILDIYKGAPLEPKKKSVCYRISMVADDIRATENLLGRFFHGLGASLR